MGLASDAERKRSGPTRWRGRSPSRPGLIVCNSRAWRCHNLQVAGEARFVTGNIMRHVVVMAGTGAIGLMAVFAVDLLNLFYISLLGQRPIAAAVGFAGVVGFFQTSVLIGLTIGTSAVVARSIGAGAARAARHIAGSGLVLMVLAGLIVGLGTVALLGPILDVLGATGETRRLAETFLMISSPSLPLLAAGMGCSGLLRCIGDARRAMNVTLFAALATAVVDPILIFGLHLGLPGAAISTVLSRLVLATLGWIGAALRHKLVARPSFRAVAGDFAAIFHVAGPALLTNLATPLGAAYVTRSMAVFGPDAVAGQATIDRISPVAFGLIYALSGAVGPILAQNAGAGRLDRVRETLRDSSILVLATVLVAWAALALDAGSGGARLLRPRRDGRARASVLLLAGRWISFHWRALRRQRGLQQSRLSGAFDGVQLGSGHSRHDPLRRLWRTFWASRCVGGSGVRLGRLRNAGIDHSLPRCWPTGHHGPQARQRHAGTLRHRQCGPRGPCRAPLAPASTPAHVEFAVSRAAISMASLKMV